METTFQMTPFVKWAGGKGQLVDKLLARVPKQFNRYYEPFVGGGALLLALAPKKATINDSNEQLINVFNQLQRNIEGVMTVIRELDSIECDKDRYYAIREQYNKKISAGELDEECAGLMIWMNKHCFNGLYRVNRKGLFNVPYNNKKTGHSFDDALRRCKEKCSFHWESNYNVYLKHGDARKLDFIPNEKIDLICTHPPYANMVKYSCGLRDDLSQLEVPEFLEQMKLVAAECYRVLKPGHYCAILMGDLRRSGFIVDLSFQVMQVFLDAGFRLRETIIKQQHNCKHTEKWRDVSVQRNFLLVAHEYLFVFKK